MNKLRAIVGIVLSKVNGVYAAAGVSGGGCLLSILPLLTEWVKFGGALAALTSGSLSVFLHLRNKKKEKAKQ